MEQLLSFYKENDKAVAKKYGESDEINTFYNFSNAKNEGFRKDKDDTFGTMCDLGLFLGDLYNETMLGLCKLDLEERIKYYNEAK